MYVETIKCRGVLQKDRNHQDYTGSLLFLDKFWHDMPYVKKNKSANLQRKICS